MRKTILFLAVSVDGYLADRRGGVDWLTGQDPGAETQDTFARFREGIDTVVMGWKTYHQVVTELSPGVWPYQGLTTYVVTHRALASTQELRFTSEDPVELVRRLREGPGRDLWVCGGANLAGQLLAAGMVDRLQLSVIPTLLGDGIRLFPGGLEETRLRLLELHSDNGIVELVYERR